MKYWLLVIGVMISPIYAQEDQEAPCPAGLFRQGDNGCVAQLTKPALPLPSSAAEAKHQRCVENCAANVQRCVEDCGADQSCNQRCSDDRFYRCLKTCTPSMRQ